MEPKIEDNQNDTLKEDVNFKKPSCNGDCETEDKGSEPKDTEIVKAAALNDSSENSDLNDKIVKQLEFYFGDFNLRRDAFLKSEMAKNDGWISVSVFEKFKRLASLSTDPDVIIDAVKNSNSSLIEVKEDEKCVRRKLDLPVLSNDEWLEKTRPRTVFVGGFPKGNEILFSQILDFFNSTCKFEAVIPRHKPSRPPKFKGSVLVIFPTVEDAENFVKLESFKFNDVELKKQFQIDHYKEKKLKIEKRKKEKLERKQQEISVIPALPKGALIKITEIPEGMQRGDLINFLLTSGLQEYAFIEYTGEQPVAYVRLKIENSAEQLLKEKFNDGQLTFKDKIMNAVVVTGEEEENKLRQMMEDRYYRLKVITNESKRKRKFKKSAAFSK